jgi:hypothetical protein
LVLLLSDRDDVYYHNPVESLCGCPHELASRTVPAYSDLRAASSQRPWRRMEVAVRCSPLALATAEDLAGPCAA